MKKAPYLREIKKGGKIYYYVRRHPKGQGVRLYAEPGTPEFWAEYKRALDGPPEGWADMLHSMARITYHFNTTITVKYDDWCETITTDNAESWLRRLRSWHPKGPPPATGEARGPAYRVPLTVGQRAEVLNRDGRQCRYCGEALDALSVDHILPVARGGTNSADNLVACCRSCNSQKKDKLLYLEWEPPCCKHHSPLKNWRKDGTVPVRRCAKCSIAATCEGSASGA